MTSPLYQGSIASWGEKGGQVIPDSQFSLPWGMIRFEKDVVPPFVSGGYPIGERIYFCLFPHSNCIIWTAPCCLPDPVDTLHMAPLPVQRQAALPKPPPTSPPEQPPPPFEAGRWGALSRPPTPPRMKQQVLPPAKFQKHQPDRPERSWPAPLSALHFGTVKVWHEDKGCGWLFQDKSDQDLFTHLEDLQEPLRYLVEGERVAYCVSWNERYKKWRATGVHYTEEEVQGAGSGSSPSGLTTSLDHRTDLPPDDAPRRIHRDGGDAHWWPEFVQWAKGDVNYALQRWNESFEEDLAYQVAQGELDPAAAREQQRKRTRYMMGLGR